MMWNGVDLNLLNDGSIGESHAHLDRLLSKEKVSHGWDLSRHSVEQVIFGWEDCWDLRRVMGKVVANFIDPRDWWKGMATELMVQCARNPNIYPTVGCHPQFWNRWDIRSPGYLLQTIHGLRRLVAIGECGFDATLLSRCAHS